MEWAIIWSPHKANNQNQTMLIVYRNHLFCQRYLTDLRSRNLNEKMWIYLHAKEMHAMKSLPPINKQKRFYPTTVCVRLSIWVMFWRTTYLISHTTSISSGEFFLWKKGKMRKFRQTLLLSSKKMLNAYLIFFVLSHKILPDFWLRLWAFIKKRKSNDKTIRPTHCFAFLGLHFSADFIRLWLHDSLKWFIGIFKIKYS